MLDKLLKIEHHNRTLNFTYYIIGSLLLGIGVGFWMGESAGKLQILGDIYVGLLQMTVVPYILFSLIANIGRLSYLEATVLMRQGVLVLAVLWLIGGLMVWGMSVTLPDIEQGAFFSSLLVSEPVQVDFLTLFIPANLFRSLAENAIPAIVLFSLLFGTACIGYKDRKSLLEICDHIAKVLLRVNSFVVMLTPIGVFGIAASTTGVLTLNEIGQVQAYVFMLIGSVLLVSFVVLPLLIASCTPFGYRQIIRESRNVLLTVFVVGSVFVVIPLLIKVVTRLFHSHVTTEHEKARIPDLVLPLAYPFPDMGKILSFVFIVFAAWFYNKPLDSFDYPVMLTIGLFLSFGKLVTALPFLLNLYHIPDDVFNLFMAVGVVCGRVADVAGTMHLMTFTILTTALMTGVFKINKRVLAKNLLICLGLFLCVALMIRAALTEAALGQPKQSPLLKMRLLETFPPYTVSTLSQPNPVALKPGQHLIDRIRKTGRIRIGIDEDSLPFSFYNAHGEMVGFDIELMLHLAQDLQVTVEFIPYESGYLLQNLEEDYFDIAVSGITPDLDLIAASRMLYTTSYLDVHLALVVPDYDRKKFRDIKAIKKLKNVRACVRIESTFSNRIGQLFPNFEVKELNTEADFFESNEYHCEVFLTTAEGGSAWTLRYPEYVVVNPFKNRQGAPLVIAVRHEDLILEHFLSTWIKIKQTDGVIDALFDYWIQGNIKQND
ncbi:cation:dicarboxylate symporter family transporter [methane-oxidizing endosymbiont of Gigantopelta aegis]|uniref:cation:dicarboxylate symporter family transporter n=1 Tax=methane-oxidizing endosymbiont of Gigantopelta aegis TaxID=2794938 RepID=UPI0018DC055D|nr:cation:dicarboxylase symporter family transporter [methane-oxidizing endosymbiont of Gigantopelta aegis]